MILFFGHRRAFLDATPYDFYGVAMSTQGSGLKQCLLTRVFFFDLPYAGFLKDAFVVL